MGYWLVEREPNSNNSEGRVGGKLKPTVHYLRRGMSRSTFLDFSGRVQDKSLYRLFKTKGLEVKKTRRQLALQTVHTKKKGLVALSRWSAKVPHTIKRRMPK